MVVQELGSAGLTACTHDKRDTALSRTVSHSVGVTVPSHQIHLTAANKTAPPGANAALERVLICTMLSRQYTDLHAQRAVGSPGNLRLAYSFACGPFITLVSTNVRNSGHVVVRFGTFSRVLIVDRTQPIISLCRSTCTHLPSLH